jgi:pyrroline-5-carboxylate reductase
MAESAADLCQDCDVLVLAVKPQIMNEALEPVASALPEQTLVISIAAGISIAYLRERLGAKARIVRVMPNTPALVQRGAAGMAFSDTCTPQDQEIAQTIFESVGVAVTVAEPDIDAVTALSGSGPAYFFYMVECLVQAAQEAGLKEEDATLLAGQTLLGAGKLLSESPDSAAELRKKVTSKGGTTEAALNAFREQGFAELIQAGVQAAAKRSQELGG